MQSNEHPFISTYQYTVDAHWDGRLLQDYFKEALGFSRRMIIDLKKGGLSVNGAHIRMVDPVHTQSGTPCQPFVRRQRYLCNGKTGRYVSASLYTVL